MGKYFFGAKKEGLTLGPPLFRFLFRVRWFIFKFLRGFLRFYQKEFYVVLDRLFWGVLSPPDFRSRELSSHLWTTPGFPVQFLRYFRPKVHHKSSLFHILPLASRIFGYFYKKRKFSNLAASRSHLLPTTASTASSPLCSWTSLIHFSIPSKLFRSFFLENWKRKITGDVVDYYCYVCVFDVSGR